MPDQPAKRPGSVWEVPVAVGIGLAAAILLLVAISILIALIGEKPDVPSFAATAAAVTAIATTALFATAGASLWLAWRNGLFSRRTTEELRRPQIGTAIYALSADEIRGLPIPTEQWDAFTLFLGKARTRDPLYFHQYPRQQYSVLVDNAGPGLALRVEIPYRLDVFERDEEFQRDVPAPDASHDGTFEVLHVSPGMQRRAALVLDTTYYPKFKLSLGIPTITGIGGGEDFSSNWTEASEDLQRTEFNNTQVWDSYRSTQWEPSRPAHVEVAAEMASSGAQGTVIAVTPQVTDSLGRPVQWSTTVNVVPAPGTVGPNAGPFTVPSGSKLFLSTGTLSPGMYRVHVAAGEAFGFAHVEVTAPD